MERQDRCRPYECLSCCSGRAGEPFFETGSRLKGLGTTICPMLGFPFLPPFDFHFASSNQNLSSSTPSSLASFALASKNSNAKGVLLPSPTIGTGRSAVV